MLRTESARIPGLLLLVLLTSGCLPQAGVGQVALGERSPRAGQVYPPAPQGVVITQGMTIGPADTARYAFAAVEEEGRPAIWLAVSLGSARERFRILDVLSVPALRPGEQLVVGLCGRPKAAGRPLRFIEDLDVDPEIVAVVRVADEPVLHPVRAWRGRRSTERFEDLDATGWVCSNEDYE
jgi:hypothetical protein